MAKRGAYQRRVPKQVAGRSQQGKSAVPLDESSFETRDLKSMKGGDWNKKPSSPALAKKRAITKPNKAASSGADLPAGGNYVK
jgi:hypothetical protein